MKPAKTILLLFLLSGSVGGNSQVMISGTVYDSTKLYGIPGIEVKSVLGSSGITDSTGSYRINTIAADSIFFLHSNKPTQKFAVSGIRDQTAFDISLPVRVNERYKRLKEVVIYSRSYRQDSMENRNRYSKGFGYSKPGLHSSVSPGTPPGLDIGELIRMFQFRRNKQNLAFQKRLIQEEQEKYVNAKFNSALIKRATGLEGAQLERFKIIYRPDFEFALNSSEVEFYEYILNSGYHFQRNATQGKAR